MVSRVPASSSLSDSGFLLTLSLHLADFIYWSGPYRVLCPMRAVIIGLIPGHKRTLRSCGFCYNVDCLFVRSGCSERPIGLGFDRGGVSRQEQGLRWQGNRNTCRLDTLHDSEKKAFLEFEELIPIMCVDVGVNFHIKRV